MKIAIVNPSDEIELGVKGGNQYIAESLGKYIKKYTKHQVMVINTPFKHYPLLSLLKSYLLHRIIDLSNFDLVISLKFPSYMIKHHNHICYFAHFYRQFYDLWPQYPHKNIKIRLVRMFIRYLDKRALKKTKKIYAYSKTIQERLQEIGIDAELLYVAPPEENFSCKKFDYILSPSILDDKRKRISLLIKAMRHIKHDTKLIIVGTGPHEKELKMLAKKDSRILFVGYKTPEELVKLYQNALCTCIVSHKEDYGLVTIESMKSKKPVITCIDSQGPLEFVEDEKTGLISKPDPESIARKLNYYIENKKQAKIMGKNAYQKVKEINWKNTLQGLLNDKK